MKLIPIPLRDFALPAPRRGSIEAYSGYARAAAEGREIHSRIQKQRAKSDSLYQAEVPISCVFERNGFAFRIDGRMDGIFRHDPPRIEEIKSTFNIHELLRRLSEHPTDHPYCLQLLSYGYFHLRENGVVPSLTFHLVSSRNRDSEDMEIKLDVPAYEEWLERRLDELVNEAQQGEKRAARRRKTAACLAFPFQNPRPGQNELMHEIEQGMTEKSPMLIQAPTGLGKTVGVLYPVLKEALGRGQNVVYVTPKNSQHAVAEDAVARLRETGSKLKSMSITAKGKICFKNEPICNPEYCEYALDYYEKVASHHLLDILARKRKLKTRLFRDLGEQYQVCPFELQIDSTRDADLIVCDYNYVFAPRTSLGRLNTFGIDQSGKPNLVIDEAHNLPARAMDYYTPALSSASLANMREELQALQPRFRREAEELLDGCIGVIDSCRTGDSRKPAKIIPPVVAFLDQDAKLRAFLTRYLDSDVEIGPRDVVMRLCFYWSEFTDILEYVIDPDRQEFFTTYHPHVTGGTVRITCCDASAMLKECYDDYEQVVGFSATLKPFEYYVRLSGLDPEKVRTAEFLTPFPKEHRKLLIIPQISTKLADRERNYAKIADAVRRITAVRLGNYFVFLPSFEFLDRIAAIFQPPPEFAILKQDRNMKLAQVEAILEHLRAGDVPTIIFAVQGGSFSEGIDYAGEMVIGAFVIGPPLPTFDLEREQMRAFYQRRYGSGFDYAYAIPAMARAIQAAGRVIRSERDRGLIVLMDGRFMEPGYSMSMPEDWFERDVKELVSESILRDVSSFWEAGESTSPA